MTSNISPRKILPLKPSRIIFNSSLSSLQSLDPTEPVPSWSFLLNYYAFALRVSIAQGTHFVSGMLGMLGMPCCTMGWMQTVILVILKWELAFFWFVIKWHFFAKVKTSYTRREVRCGINCWTNTLHIQWSTRNYSHPNISLHRKLHFQNMDGES